MEPRPALSEGGQLKAADHAERTGSGTMVQATNPQRVKGSVAHCGVHVIVFVSAQKMVEEYHVLVKISVFDLAFYPLT